MRSVDEHLADCLALVRPLPALALDLGNALDCVLTRDVVSGVRLPPFDNSGMDGYAVVTADVAGASVGSPVVLPVVGDLPAGATRVEQLVAGTAVRIMTGAPVPPGTGAVVPVEWTDRGTERVRIDRAPADGQNVRAAGDDVEPGDLLLRAGTRLSPRHIGLLAAAGHARVTVRPRPRVVVMSTGRELVEPGRPLAFGEIFDSNSYALAAAVTDAGAVAHRVAMVDDDPGALVEALEVQLGRADLLITTGGVSAGAYDTVKEVLSGLGTVRFDRVAMQPGMPQGVGTLGDRRQDDGSVGTPIFTLPGNPVSAFVSFEVFVRPALRVMLGETELQRPLVTAAATRSWSSPAGKRQFARVLVEGEPDDRTVRPVGGQRSNLVADLAGSNALAVVGEDVTAVAEGDRVECLLLERGRR